MPHYRTMLTSDNFAAADLWSEKGEKYVEVDVQIVAVARGEVVGEKGRKKGMPFVTMRSAKTGQEIQKPLGLNTTNCQTVATLAGSPDVKRWPGVWLTLYVTKTEMGKEVRDCIRVRPESPKREASAPPEPSRDAADVRPEDRHG